MKKIKKIYIFLESWADAQLRKMINSKYTFWLLFLYVALDIITIFVDFEIIFGNML